MSLFGSIAGLFSGNAASNAIKDANRQNRRLANETYADQTAQIDPYLGAGRNALADLDAFRTGGVDYLGQSGEALLGNALRDTSGQYAAMGLSDSGAGRNALLDRALELRRGLRSDFYNEALQRANIGQNALGAFIGAGNTRLGAVTGANTNIGEARAGNALNFGNQLAGVADQGLDAILKAATGGAGFLPGLAKQAGGFA